MSTAVSIDDLKYPVGKFQAPETISAQEREAAIEEIASAPAAYGEAVKGWTEEQLDTEYRPDGWTVRQVLHHVPESHMNSYIRFKLALTESEPTIKPYDEVEWAKLPDATSAPIEPSLRLLEALHMRWVDVLRRIRDEEWSRTFVNPEVGVRRLDTTLLIYAWHCRHHLAHITGLRDRMGW